MKKKLPFHYAWIILVCCCVLNGAGLGMLINSRGLYLSPVTSTLGCSATAFTFSITCYGLAAAASARFTTPIFERFGMRRVLVIAMGLLSLSVILMGTYQQIWQWYLSGLLQGASGAFILYIPAPLLINRWFIKRKGFALSISSMFTGLFGILSNQIISRVILSYGWRVAYFVHGGMAFLFALPFLAFLVVDHPEDMGLRPYGAEEVTVKGTEDDEAHGGLDVMDGQALRCCIIMGMCFAFCTCFSHHLTNHSVRLGWGLAVGASLTSLAMFGNVFFKLLLGTVSDRMGPRLSGLVTSACSMIGFFLLFIGVNSQALSFAGAFLYGIPQAVFTVTFPFVVSSVFSRRTFGKAYAICNTGTMLSNAFGTLIISATLDLTGAYRFAFVIALILLGLAFTMVYLAFRRTKFLLYR